MLSPTAVMQNQLDEHQPLPQSPAMHLPGQASPPGPPAGRDKPRSRLGYHRTSVACVNCRHRKIRCQVASGEERCLQCIRLRKSCKFQSVDQQTGQERAGSLSEDASPPEMAPLVLTASPEAVPPEVPGSYTDYNHQHQHQHQHPHGGMLPNGVGGDAGLHAPSPPVLLSERPPDATMATCTPWLPAYLGTSMPTAGLSPYPTHDPLQHQHPHPMHTMHSPPDLHTAHALHSPNHGLPHVFHPALGSSNGVTEAPWSPVSVARAHEPLQQWNYPPP